MPPKRSRPSTRPLVLEYLNTDLEIGSRLDLAPLIAELSPKLIELFVGRLGALQRAHYELPFDHPAKADATILAFVRVLKKLGPAARRVWNRAHVRDFNIGVQSGAGATALELILERATLEEVTALGARVVVTIYPLQS